jgi:hypothetical protein
MRSLFQCHHFRRGLRATTVALAMLCMTIAVYATHFYQQSGGRLEAKLLDKDVIPKSPWQVYKSEELDEGVSVPAGTNTVFTIPYDVNRINREVLFGHQGKNVRYWGYCYPDDYTAKAIKQVGLPGKIFLSEAERAWREAQRLRLLGPLTIYHIPEKRDVAARAEGGYNTIQHQLEVFKGGQTCYVMTEKPLALGTDRDNDMLNAMEERLSRTSPYTFDTDGDGLGDGIEKLFLHTNVLIRDSDGDGIIDGIEDKNRNGRLDPSETNPLDPDSDHDGLCDGLCRIARSGRFCTEFSHVKDCVVTADPQWRGEDKNGNGVRDSGETDPLDPDSDHNGILDLQEYFNCLNKKQSEKGGSKADC